MNDKKSCCCFTGHRIIKAEHASSLPEKLNSILRKLYDGGVRDFISGGALGFDTLAAEAVLALRRELSDIRLILALPCRKQAKGWHKKHIEKYNSILSEADEIIYVSEEYTPDCMHKRNRFMIDNCSHCIFYLENMRSGTAYTIRYALKSDIELHNIIIQK